MIRKGLGVQHPLNDASRAPSQRSGAPSPLGYSTKSELVYRYLREQIVNGIRLPGEHLYLQEIATALHVSTVPVREALRLLESEGLITNRPHAGATVSALNHEAIEVHFLIRGALEGLAVRLAAAHLTPDRLERLRGMHDELCSLADSGDHVAWNERNIAFYRTLFEASASADLVAMIDLQRDRSPRYRHFPEVLAQRARSSGACRTALLHALSEHDSVTAEQLQRERVGQSGRELLAAIRRQEHAHERDADIGVDGTIAPNPNHGSDASRAVAV